MALTMKKVTLLMTMTASLALAACDGGSNNGDASDSGMADEGTGDSSGGDEGADAGTGDDGPTEPIDTDGDGLTDEEEAVLGTDPTLVDTDNDNYWDSWEVNEGTDPLDPESRIYIGYWPYNPNKDELEQGTWAGANTNVGTPLPRAEFLDQNNQLVDLYDLGANNKYQVLDTSAQWCGPCHNVADWLAGANNSNTAGLQQQYPTVRDKVHTYKIMWITFIVENQSGGPPTLSDSTSWASQHPDPYIPVLVDDTQGMRNNYVAGAFPTFFIGAPDMKIEFFPTTDVYQALQFVNDYDF